MSSQLKLHFKMYKVFKDMAGSHLTYAEVAKLSDNPNYNSVGNSLYYLENRRLITARLRMNKETGEGANKEYTFNKDMPDLHTPEDLKQIKAAPKEKAILRARDYKRHQIRAAARVAPKEAVAKTFNGAAQHQEEIQASVHVRLQIGDRTELLPLAKAQKLFNTLKGVSEVFK